ncbi:MAG: hypothetical protein PHH75_05515 [Candidatus Omnitrophica bacterium]|nr:hypothetical protein [Candidatus Omnitrophota bacterium]
MPVFYIFIVTYTKKRAMGQIFKQVIRACADFLVRMIDEEFRRIDEFCRPY